METRKITVVDSQSQSVKVIMSAAETLGELKQDLLTNGYSLENKAFYEGLTRIELKTDNSILPHDVPRNGTTTNELVIRITTAQKKINSGMTRAEVYQAIKEKNLAETVKNMYGKNFTQCSTADLLAVIAASGNNEVTAPSDESVVDSNTELIEKSIAKLQELLNSGSNLSDAEVFALNSFIDGTLKEALVSPYSEEELESMFNF